MLSLVKGRVAEQHGRVGVDGEVAELARGEGVALGPGDGALDHGVGGERGEVAEVLRVPERELGDRAVLDVLPHLVRRAEAGDGDLALRVGRRDVPGRGGDAHGGRSPHVRARWTRGPFG
ncbi:hypothetical protein GCM10027054_04080 [Isoptericola nanjingensis]